MRYSAEDKVGANRAWMCRNSYTFGAVMSTTAFNCGQVRGPLAAYLRVVGRPYLFHRSQHRAGGLRQVGERKRIAGDEPTRSQVYRSPRSLPCSRIRERFSGGSEFREADLDLLWSALRHMFDHAVRWPGT